MPDLPLAFHFLRPWWLVLLPLVAQAVDVPIIAAGGIVDGPSMAAAFALGAEGVQLGTRMDR